MDALDELAGGPVLLKYVGDGTVKQFILWNGPLIPVDAGIAAAFLR